MKNVRLRTSIYVSISILGLFIEACRSPAEQGDLLLPVSSRIRPRSPAPGGYRRRPGGPPRPEAGQDRPAKVDTGMVQGTTGGCTRMMAVAPKAAATGIRNPVVVSVGVAPSTAPGLPGQGLACTREGCSPVE